MTPVLLMQKETPVQKARREYQAKKHELEERGASIFDMHGILAPYMDNWLRQIKIQHELIIKRRTI